MSWRELLTEQRFRQFSPPDIGHENAETAWQKRVEWSGNDDADDAFVQVYQYVHGISSEITLLRFQVDCTFERGDGTSMHVEVYSLTEEQLIERLAELVDEFVALRLDVAATI